ncbi:hypothetical protein F5B22DRAFT_170846 [Xylaria bambusicola]|uniref:uncharacterized protein n=1 Tax=Xylaria bambusicola TaxID=326684 RepID=UPI002008BBF0|nr:uncharacterized protein F5B22DRAFT_170846 [Xylaria bambusicola]KAI0526668.1 hypothetical protein F5B22DRAFT_170846 [Xylaria bambusicola]
MTVVIMTITTRAVVISMSTAAAAARAVATTAVRHSAVDGCRSLLVVVLLLFEVGSSEADMHTSPVKYSARSEVLSSRAIEFRASVSCDEGIQDCGLGK